MDVPWSRKPLYLVAFLDDNSRYVVSFGLYPHQKADIVLEALELGISRYSRPTEVLSDQGRQYFAWRGTCDFQKRLKKLGIRHVVARAHHPQTVGKCERFWKTLQEELWSRVMLKDLEDARTRLSHFVAHYNHFRCHQSLDGLTPADRYFGAASEVKSALEAAMAKNELHLAVGEAPRKPVFLVGQIDGQSVSVHGEGGKVVVQMADGEKREIEAKDLGIHPKSKEEVKDGDQREQGGDDRRDDDGGDSGAGGGVPAGPAGGPGPAPANGAQAPVVPGAAEDAAAGEGAVGAGDPRGAAAGAPHGGGDPVDLARQVEP